MRKSSIPPAARAVGFVFTAVLVFATGCSHERMGLPFDDVRPGVEFTEGVLQGTESEYSIRFGWNSWDSDGRVVRHEYAVDPSADGDTTWIRIASSQITLFYRSDQPQDPLPGEDHSVVARGGHTFVVRAIDEQGMPSAPIARSFTSRTIAPFTQILTPPVSDQQPSATTPSVLVTWNGFDPDGLLSQKPIRYKWKIVPATDIDPQAPLSITAGRVQEYFEADAYNRFAAWDSVSGDTTSLSFEGLTPGTLYYLALSAIDEAGAYEPRFRRGTNVLWFQPSLNRLGPALCVFNEFFRHCFKTGGVSTVESRKRDVELPASTRVAVSWQGTPLPGTVLNGYRWALDIANGDITDESPRANDNDLQHWSSWSLNETQVLLPSFPPPAFEGQAHFLYVEVRDNLGFITLMTLRLRPVAPTFDRPLLVVDDTFGTRTPVPVRFVGPYPMEAEEDSFHFAQGGFPDPLTGTLSERGVFADYAPAVIDYESTPEDGVALATLSHYRAVVWFTDHNSAGRTGLKGASLRPSTALRLINSANRLNTLAVYLRQGGKVWLFGDGTPTAIVNGFANQVGQGTPMLPYTSGTAPGDLLRPGDFLWDFVHLRSEMDLGDRVGGSPFYIDQQFKGAIPYLPAFAGPPDQPPPADRSTDPRIGPSCARTALRFSGLPRLTLAAYRGANIDATQRSVPKLGFVAQPLFVLEGVGAAFGSTVDTLYLFQARLYDPTGARAPSDGKPDALYYHGSEHGELVWTAFPLNIVEREQARQLVAKVMDVFGIAPQAVP
jgi:hypothetical protein